MPSPFRNGGEQHADQLNGEPYELPAGRSVADLLVRLDLTGRRLAVELNRDIVPQHRAQPPNSAKAITSRWCTPSVAASRSRSSNCAALRRPVNNTSERGIPMRPVPHDKPFTLAGRTYQSRLVGTGKYKDLEETRVAIEASGAEIVTVAVRRTNIGQGRDLPM